MGSVVEPNRFWFASKFDRKKWGSCSKYGKNRNSCMFEPIDEPKLINKAMASVQSYSPNHTLKERPKQLARRNDLKRRRESYKVSSPHTQLSYSSNFLSLPFRLQTLSRDRYPIDQLKPTQPHARPLLLVGMVSQTHLREAGEGGVGGPRRLLDNGSRARGNLLEG